MFVHFESENVSSLYTLERELEPTELGKNNFVRKKIKDINPFLYHLLGLLSIHFNIQFSSVHSLSRVWLFATPWIAARQASLSITNSQSSLKLTSIESVMSTNHLILCHPLLLLPSIFPGIRIFSNESALLMRWPKYWSFNFSISPSNEYLGLISFRIAWFVLLVSKGLSRVFSITTVWKHQFFSAQPSLWFNSHQYMTTGKTTALTTWTLLSKWCLCFLVRRRA